MDNTFTVLFCHIDMSPDSHLKLRLISEHGLMSIFKTNPLHFYNLRPKKLIDQNNVIFKLARHLFKPPLFFVNSIFV